MNSVSSSIRDATHADLETIVRFNAALASESEGLTLDPHTLTEGVREALRDPSRARYFVAEVGGVIAGQIMITTEWSDWRNGFFWWIQSVYVDPAHRRRGVFRALHNHIREQARRQLDVCGLRLYVHHDNVRAIETYKKLGMNLAHYHLCEECWISEHRTQAR